MQKENILIKLIVLLMISLFFNSCEASSEVQPNDQDKKIQQQFDNFIVKRGRKFKDSNQKKYRSKIFKEKAKKIKKINSDRTRTDKHQINEFADLTQKQFYQTHLNPQMDFQYRHMAKGRLLQTATPVVTWSVNLTANGKVSPVKNQGSCGSCWAFAAVGSLQFLSLNKTNTQVDLSEQQYVDCVYARSGCRGGWPATALLYTKANGSQLEINYNYTAKYTGSCAIQTSTFKITNVNYASGCQALANTARYSAVTVALNASTWSSYNSGVIQSISCETTSINHAVLLVGVTPQYWIIKNSWGNKWGQYGYIKLQLGNTCGICLYSGSYAV